VVPPAIDQLSLGPLGTNCYVVRADRGAAEAVVVDPSGSATELRLRLASMGARCAAILVTHAHFDHILGLADLAEGTGAPVHAPEAERVALEEPARFTPAGVTVRPCTPDVVLRGGETLELAGTSFAVRPVPGHSPGHLAYAVDGGLLSGDVLFAGSVGRTDLPGGDWETLLDSIRMLIDAYPPETVVYPGHGATTTLGAELAGNPFLGDLRLERRDTG
jgi:hydroxyacylglutathione hydrolase